MMEQTPRPHNPKEGRPVGISQRIQLPRPNRSTNPIQQRTSSGPEGPRPKPAGTKPPKKRKKTMPLWSKALIIAGLVLGSGWVGMILGYTVVGKRPLGEALSFSTWKHLFDLIFG